MSRSSIPPDVARLLQVIAERDRDIERLRQANHAAMDKADEAEHRATALEKRLDDMDDALRTLRSSSSKAQTTSLLQQQRRNVAPAATPPPAADPAVLRDLHTRIAELERQLEDEVHLRRGEFPYLGLRVQDDGAAGAVRIAETRGPAVMSGIAVGDTLTHVTVSRSYPIERVADYERCVAEMPRGAHAVVAVRRGTTTREVLVESSTLYATEEDAERAASL